jgi:hypothetical protein
MEHRRSTGFGSLLRTRRRRLTRSSSPCSTASIVHRAGPRTPPLKPPSSPPARRSARQKGLPCTGSSTVDTRLPSSSRPIVGALRTPGKTQDQGHDHQRARCEAERMVTRHAAYCHLVLADPPARCQALRLRRTERLGPSSRGYPPPIWMDGRIVPVHGRIRRTGRI